MDGTRSSSPFAEGTITVTTGTGRRRPTLRTRSPEPTRLLNPLRASNSDDERRCRGARHRGWRDRPALQWARRDVRDYLYLPDGQALWIPFAVQAIRGRASRCPDRRCWSRRRCPTARTLLRSSLRSAGPCRGSPNFAIHGRRSPTTSARAPAFAGQSTVASKPGSSARRTPSWLQPTYPRRDDRVVPRVARQRTSGWSATDSRRYGSRFAAAGGCAARAHPRRVRARRYSARAAPAWDRRRGSPTSEQAPACGSSPMRGGGSPRRRRRRSGLARLGGPHPPDEARDAMASASANVCSGQARATASTSRRS